MSASEAIRHRIYEGFLESHGEGMAADMLKALPPAGLPDLATKDDVALVRADMGAMEARLRLEIVEAHSELKGEIAERFNRSVHVNLGAIAVATALLGLLVTLA